MNSILNDLNKEIKEETEEEKIDIENHFLPQYLDVRKTS